MIWDEINHVKPKSNVSFLLICVLDGTGSETIQPAQAAGSSEEMAQCTQGDTKEGGQVHITRIPLPRLHGLGQIQVRINNKTTHFLLFIHTLIYLLTDCIRNYFVFTNTNGL